MSKEFTHCDEWWTDLFCDGPSRCPECGEEVEAIPSTRAQEAPRKPLFTVKAAHVVSLQEAPRKRSMCETKMRYDVLLNGKFFGELYFNMRGYVGLLPLPGGQRLDIGERSISAFKSEMRVINREAKQ